MNAFIHASGHGTRLKPYTDSIPKCLLPVGHRPLLDYWVEQLAKLPVETIAVTASNHAPLFDSYALNRNTLSSEGAPSIIVLHEDRPLGSAGSIAKHREYGRTSKEFICVYGDNLCQANLKNMLEVHRQGGRALTMACFTSSAPETGGVVEMDRTGNVIAFTEKPKVPASNLVNAGIYIFDQKLFLEIADRHTVDWSLDVIPELVAQGRVKGWLCDGAYLDIGTPASFKEAQRRAPALELKYNRAIFFDRDGTLIENERGLKDISRVQLRPGAREAVMRAKSGGYLCVLVSNQAAVSEGVLSCVDVDSVNAEVNLKLGNTLDAAYFAPQARGSDHFERKPNPGMAWKAAADFCLNLSKCWTIGDADSDGLFSENAGCAGFLKVGPDLSILDAVKKIT